MRDSSGQGLRALLGAIRTIPAPREEFMRYITVRALWACADVLDIVRDGLIVLAARTVR